MDYSALHLHLLLLLLIPITTASTSINEDQQPPRLMPPSTAPYWTKFKALCTYLFPPNLHFRGHEGGGGIEGGAADKVKQVVTNTLHEGKATLEESAKSAANLVKDTLSSPPASDPEEL